LFFPLTYNPCRKRIGERDAMPFTAW